MLNFGHLFADKFERSIHPNIILILELHKGHEYINSNQI